MAARRKIPGVKYVDVPGSENLYTSYGAGGASPFLKDYKTGAQKRREAGAKFTKQSERVLSQMKYNEQKSIEVVSGGKGFGATRRAIEKANLGAPVFVFDTENLGQTSAGKGMDEDSPLFAITQFSFAKFPNLGAMKNAQTEDVKNVVFGLPKKAEQTLRQTVKSLKDDPLTYYDLDQRTKESLGDLVTMSNVDHYGSAIEMDGKFYKTISGQEEAAKASMAVLTSKKTIGQMETALDLLTNPKLVTDPEAMTSLVESLTSGGAVGIGHNVEAHDQLGIEQHLREVGAPQTAVQRARDNMIDTLPLSKQVVNKHRDKKSSRSTLGALYKNITKQSYGEVMAHNAADDVLMNIEVANELLESTYVGRRNRRREISPGDMFQVDLGLNYRPNPFSKNEGQFDMVTRIDSETGKEVLQYEGLQRGTGRGGRVLEFIGAIEPMEIDGVEHFGVKFFSEEEDTYHTFFRRTQSGIDDIFNQHLVPAGTMKQDKIDYINKDRARRRYLDLFSPDATRVEDSVANRLGVAYDILDTYEEQKKAMSGVEGVTELDILKSTRDIVNENKENKDFPFGMSRIQDTVYLKDKLQSEREMLQDVVRGARAHAGASTDPLVKTRRENIYVNKYMSALIDQSEQAPYGHSGMEMLKLRGLTPSDEVSYRNIETDDHIRGFVGGELYRDIDRVREGKSSLHTKRVLETIKDKVTPEKYDELKKTIERDQRRNEISPGVIDEISNIISNNKSSLKRQGKIVDSVAGLDIETPLTNELLEESSDFKGLDDFIKNIERKTDAILSRTSGDARRALDTPDVREILQRSDEIAEVFKSGIIETNESILGTKSKIDIFSNNKAEDRLKKVLKIYHDLGFQVRIERQEDGDKLRMFATPDKELDITGMSYGELESHDSIIPMTIPLYNENYAIQTNTGSVRDIKKLRIDGKYDESLSIDDITPGKVEIVGVSDLLFEEIEKTPYLVRNELNKGHTVGDAVKSSNARLNNMSQTLGIAADYTPFTGDDMGYNPSSREKNRRALIDMSEFYELYAKEHRPDEYNKFIAQKYERGGSQNITDFLNKHEGDGSRFRVEVMDLYKQTVGDLTGIQLHPDGINPNQSRAAIVGMTPSTMGHPLPEMSNPAREQATKTSNYRLMNRQRMQDYFASRYGEDDIKTKMTMNPAQSAFTNMAGTEEELRSFQTMGIKVGEERLAEGNIQIEKDLRIERDKILSTPGELTEESKQRVSQLDRMIGIVELGPSNFEDQAIVIEEIAQEIQSDEYLQLDLESYELDKSLETQLRLRTGTESAKDLTQGRYILDDDLDLDYLKTIDVVSEGDFLTIGVLQGEEIKAEGSKTFFERKRKRLQPDASVYGFDVNPDGTKSLLVKNPYVGRQGMKTIGGDSGVRETNIFIPEELGQRYQDFFGVEGEMNFIRAFEKMGPGQRGGTGSAYTDLVRTSAWNIGTSIDELHRTGETSNKAIAKYFEGGVGADVQSDYQKYIQEQFVPEVNALTGSDFLASIEGDESPFEFRGTTIVGTPEEKQEALRRLMDVSIGKYDVLMEEDMAQVVGSTMLHNIDPWAGLGTKPKFGRTQMNVLSQIVKGPAESQAEKIREFGVIGDTDFSDFSFDIKLPGESLVERNFKRLAREGNLGAGDTYESLIRMGSDRREAERYARSVRSSLEGSTKGLDEESIMGAGNVIVDAAGAYTFEDGSNILTIGEGENQYHVIDGSTIKLTPQKGMPTGAQLKGTYANLETVNIYNDELDTTIGDLVKEQNASVFVKMMDPDNPLAEDAQLKNNVVEAIPMLSGERWGTSYQMQAEMAQTRAFEGSHKLSYEVPDGIIDPEAWVGSNINQMREGISDFEAAAGRFLGGASTKEAETILRDNSTSFYLEGRNMLSSGYDVGDVVMTEVDTRALLKGVSQTVIDANEVSEEMLVKFSGYTSDEYSQLDQSALGRIREDYIIDQLKGVKDEDSTFDFYGPMYREPVDSESSLRFSTIRVDTTGKIRSGTASLDPRTAGAMGGDFDGDAANIVGYAYSENTTKEDAIAVQRELRELSKMSTGLAILETQEGHIESIKEEGKNSYLALLDITDSDDLEKVFAEKKGSVQNLWQVTADASMDIVVGQTYNTFNPIKEALYDTTNMSMLLDPSEENRRDMRELETGFNQLLRDTQQESISKKKTEMEQILHYAGIQLSDENRTSYEEMYEAGELQDYAQAFDAGRAKIARRIEGISPSSAPDIHDELQRLSIISYDAESDEDILRSESNLNTLTRMGRINEAWGSTGYGSFSNTAIKHGYSSSDEGRQKVIEQIIETPEKVPYLPKLVTMAEQQIGDQPDVLAAWKESSEKTAVDIFDTIGRLEQKAATAGPTFEDSENIISQIAQSSIGDVGDLVTSQSQMFESAKQGLSSVVQSDSFKVGAGIAAAWTAMRVMSKGPTPEGNEAQQEQATPQEIAPSQLLTSPTARVTPGAETINLDIYGQGNLSQEQAATVVNNEIAAMTGTQMNMNINVSDNTAKLDNRFYQSAVDKVFGI